MAGSIAHTQTNWSVYLTVSVSGGGKGIGGESGENCAVFGRRSSPAKSGENRRPHRTDRYQLYQSALYTRFTQSVNRIWCILSQQISS